MAGLWEERTWLQKAEVGRTVLPPLPQPPPSHLQPSPAPALFTLLGKACQSLSPRLSPPQQLPSPLAVSQECIMVSGSNFIFKMLLSKI